MSKVKWDEIGEHYVETGTDRGMLYVMNAEGTYNAGVPWNGLTGIDENPEGAEANDFYADDIKYVTLRSAERLKYTIKAFGHPDEFYECDGTKEVAPGVYIGQQARAGFGFSYRSKIYNDTATAADDAYKIHIYYNSTASPTDRNYATINDNPDANEFSWECDSTPVPCTDNRPVSSIVVDTRSISSEKLKILEDKLYGTDAVEADADHGIEAQEATEPTLPSPDEIIELLAA